jgi:hypothetical protein
MQQTWKFQLDHITKKNNEKTELSPTEICKKKSFFFNQIKMFHNVDLFT